MIWGVCDGGKRCNPKRFHRKFGTSSFAPLPSGFTPYCWRLVLSSMGRDRIRAQRFWERRTLRKQNPSRVNSFRQLGLIDHGQPGHTRGNPRLPVAADLAAPTRVPCSRTAYHTLPPRCAAERTCWNGLWERSPAEPGRARWSSTALSASGCASRRRMGAIWKLSNGYEGGDGCEWDDRVCIAAS